MKKLIILASLAICALSLNAATCNWTWTGQYATDSNGGTSWLGAGSVVNLYAVGIDSGKDKLIDTYTFTGSEITGTFSVSLQTQTEDFTVGETYTFYLTILDTKDMLFTTPEDQYRSAKATSSTVGAILDFATMQPITAVSSNWTPAPVPEPTSGLLLLMGMGALALRRKQK